MKTIVVLENSELEKISAGEPLNLRLADGSSITIQAEVSGKSRTAGSEKRRPKSKKDGGPYRCRCGKVFDSYQGLGGHQRICTQDKKASRKPSAKEKLLICSVGDCDRRFVHQAWLENHKRREHSA